MIYFFIFKDESITQREGTSTLEVITKDSITFSVPRNELQEARMEKSFFAPFES